MATARTMTADAYRNAGELDEAWTYNIQSFSFMPTISVRSRHIVLAGGVSTALRSDDSGAALVLARLALANDTSWANTSGVISAWYQIAVALHGLGRTTEALDAIAEARRVLAASPVNADTERTEAEILARDGAVRLETDPAGAVTSLMGAITKLTALNLPTRLPALRLQRARAERALGRREDAIADLQAGISIFEDQRTTLRSDQLRTSRFDQAWALYGDLIDLERADPQASLDVAERARSRALLDSLSRTQEIPPLRGHDMHEWMPAGETAIVYATLADRLLIWTVTHDGISLTERPVSAERLKTMVTAFVNDSRAGHEPANGRELAAIVLPDRLQAAATGRLAFLPDGPLYLLPFAQLPSGPGGAPLVTTTVTTIAPSLTILARLAQAPRPPAGGPRQALLVGYGQGRPSDGLAALPDVDGEISDLAHLYSDHAVLTGQTASPRRILAALADASIVHFAGHAIADEAYPSDSRLLVAPDETGLDVIKPDAIAASHLRPDTVVVLSACDTARGRIVHGEGAMSLSRPFLAAGASAVVASLWPVRDEDSRAVLEAWHARAAKGMPAAQALAETQREFLTARHSTAAFAFEVIGADRSQLSREVTR
jgi:tetratricopeptide (TPR) repeat protein